MTRSQRWIAPAGVLTAFLGAWAAHSIEFIRVDGWSNTSALASPFTGVHAYMIPVGLAVLMAVSLQAVRLHRLWHGLLTRLEDAQTQWHEALSHRTRRSAANGLQHGQSTPPPLPERRNRRFAAQFASVFVPLLAVQLTTYVIQENLEFFSQRHQFIGLGVFLGVHWAAIPIHAAIAAVLAFSIALALGPLPRLISAIQSIERATAHFLRRHLGGTPRLVGAPASAPSDWLGHALDRRPPPAPNLA